MNLLDLVESLDQLDDQQTIYAKRPWTESSSAIAAVEPTDGSLPRSAAQAALEYFLEVFIAREFLEDWEKTQSAGATDRDRCRRLIQYAERDA